MDSRQAGPLRGVVLLFQPLDSLDVRRFLPHAARTTDPLTLRRLQHRSGIPEDPFRVLLAKRVSCTTRVMSRTMTPSETPPPTSLCKQRRADSDDLRRPRTAHSALSLPDSHRPASLTVTRFRKTKLVTKPALPVDFCSTHDPRARPRAPALLRDRLCEEVV